MGCREATKSARHGSMLGLHLLHVYIATPCRTGNIRYKFHSSNDGQKCCKSVNI